MIHINDCRGFFSSRSFLEFLLYKYIKIQLLRLTIIHVRLLAVNGNAP